MEDLLHDFLLNYFQCSLGKRNFEDHCRRLFRHDGPISERKQLLDEYLNDANSISADIPSSNPAPTGFSQSCKSRAAERCVHELCHETLSYCQEDKAMADALDILLK